MTVLWPQLSRSKNAYAAAEIEHVTYIFPDNDGYLYREDAAYSETWINGTKTGQAYQYLNTYQPGAPDGGINDVLTPAITVPALPDVSIYESIFGYVDLGLHRTSLRVRCNTANTNLDTAGNNDSTRGHISIVGSNSLLNTIIPAGSYTDRNGIDSGVGVIISEYATSNETYYRNNDVFVQSEEYEDDYAGETIRWSMHADAVDNPPTGDTFQSHSEVWTRELYQSTKMSTGGIGWDGCQSASEAEFKYDIQTNADAGVQGSNQFGLFGISRAFFEFDTSHLNDGNDRTITESIFHVTGYGYNESDNILQISTHAGGATWLEFGDYDAIGSVISDVIDWQLLEGFFPYQHNVTLNSTGLTYVTNQVAGGSDVKFCLREYDHDYLDVEPSVYNVRFRNGLYFSEMSAAGTFVYAPYLKLTYNKSPEWTNRTDESYWSVFQGTWNGSGWDSNASHRIGMDVSGTWANNKRWSAIRLTFTGANSIFFGLEDKDDTVISSTTVLTPGEILTIPWRAHQDDTDYDFDYFYTLNTSAAPWTLTKIEFLEI